MMMIKKEISIDITCAGILEREKYMPSSLSSSSIDCLRSDFVKRLYSVRKNDFSRAKLVIILLCVCANFDF